jgi:hypothetical protein
MSDQAAPETRGVSVKVLATVEISVDIVGQQ